MTGAVLVVVLAVTLVLVERRHPDPIVPSALLRRPNVLVANIVLMLNAGALGAALYFATLTMQTEMGYGPLQTGLGFAPITVVVLLVSPRAGALIERFGAHALLVAGAAFGALGAALLATTSSVADTYWAGILPGLTLMAVGSGLSYAPTFSLATSVPEDQHGRASGLINTSQELGAAAGLAAIGALAASAAGGAAAGGQLVDFTAGYLSAAAAMALAAARVLLLRPKMITFTRQFPSSPGVPGGSGKTGDDRGRRSPRVVGARQPAPSPDRHSLPDPTDVMPVDAAERLVMSRSTGTATAPGTRRG